MDHEQVVPRGPYRPEYSVTINTDLTDDKHRFRDTLDPITYKHSHTFMCVIRNMLLDVETHT